MTDETLDILNGSAYDDILTAGRRADDAADAAGTSGRRAERVTDGVDGRDVRHSDIHVQQTECTEAYGDYLLRECGSEGGTDFSTATSYGIDLDNLNFSNTVQNHTGRPFQDSKLLINEIIESKPPVPDPRGTNAWSWTVEGSFNGSTGYYELIIDPESNTVWHFVFKSQ